MEEIWKDLIGYEGSYKVSTLGRFKSIPRNGTVTKGKIMTPIISPYGYMLVCLHHKGVQKTERTHRMIAKTFIPNPDNKPQVNHKNGIKTDNRVENLEWCTPSENLQHAYDTGLKKVALASEHHNASLDELQALCVLACLKDGMLRIELARYFQVSLQTVSMIGMGRHWIFRNKDVKRPKGGRHKTERFMRILPLLNMVSSHL